MSKIENPAVARIFDNYPEPIRKKMMRLRQLVLARIHRWTGMDGVRAAEGGEGVTGAMIRGLEFG